MKTVVRLVLTMRVVVARKGYGASGRPFLIARRKVNVIHMLYVLLLIIAIGVLLISEVGRKLLVIFGKVLLVGGAIVLGIGLVGGLIAAFVNKDTRDVAGSVLGVAFLALIIIVYSYSTWKDRKQIPEKLRGVWKTLKSPAIIFFIFLYLGIAALFVYASTRP